MPRLSRFNYNYRLTKHIKNEENGMYEKVYDQLFSQLSDMQGETGLNIRELQYLARHDSILRSDHRYKGLSIKKIHPVPIY
jgi:hypothetical protein